MIMNIGDKKVIFIKLVKPALLLCLSILTLTAWAAPDQGTTSPVVPALPLVVKPIEQCQVMVFVTNPIGSTLTLRDIYVQASLSDTGEVMRIGPQTILVGDVGHFLITNGGWKSCMGTYVIQQGVMNAASPHSVSEGKKGSTTYVHSTFTGNGFIWK